MLLVRAGQREPETPEFPLDKEGGWLLESEADRVRKSIFSHSIRQARTPCMHRQSEPLLEHRRGSSRRKRRSMHVGTMGRPHHFPQDTVASPSRQDDKQRRAQRSASPCSLWTVFGLPIASLLVLPGGNRHQQRRVRSEKRSSTQLLPGSFNRDARIARCPHERTPST
jgi:hypothetical protein